MYIWSIIAIGLIAMAATRYYLRSTDKKNLIYFDNGLFRRLSEQGKEEVWNIFFDNLVVLDHRFANAKHDLEIVFNGSSLLEAIGLGRIKENTAVKQLKIKLKSDLMAREVVDWSSYVLDEAYSFFSAHLPLQRSSLISRIETQINKYSTSKAAIDLVDSSLGSWRDNLKAGTTHYDLLLVQLAWDFTCSFPYFELLEKNTNKEEALCTIYGALFVLWDYFRDLKIELSIYRVIHMHNWYAANLPEYYKKVQAQLAIGPIGSIELFGKVDSKHDMCDVDFVHYALFGMRGNRIIMFTMDEEEVVENRLKECLRYLRDSKKNIPQVLADMYIVKKDFKIEKLDIEAMLSSIDSVKMKVNH